MKPIVLTGIAGAGKSTSGKIVAEKLGFEFVDTDLIIERAFGKELDDVLEELGQHAFSQKEGEIFIREFQPGRVIAPGGSIVYQERAMGKACSEGFVVFIEIDFETWIRRIGGKRPRGFLLMKGKDIKEEYYARAPLYAKYAHFRVDGSMPLEHIAEMIVEEYRRRFLK